MNRPARRLVIGVGNPERGDDAAGRLVARRLRDQDPHATEVRECAGEATALLDAWDGFDDVVVVDACLGAGAPGTIHRFTSDDVDRLARLRPLGERSTHALDLPVALALARALGTLPSHLVIYSIEGRDFRIGSALTASVDRAVDELVALLVHETPAQAQE